MLRLKETPKDLTGFKNFLASQNCLNIIVFTTDWSGSGFLVTSALRSLKEQYKGQIDFFRLDAPDANEIKEAYQLCQIPTILFFFKDKLINCTKGITSRSQLEEIIVEALGRVE